MLYCVAAIYLASCSWFLEIALISVYFDQFASRIVNIDHGIKCDKPIPSLAERLTN
jgi:hypothetical protein